MTQYSGSITDAKQAPVVASVTAKNSVPGSVPMIYIVCPGLSH